MLSLILDPEALHDLIIGFLNIETCVFLFLVRLLSGVQRLPRYSVCRGLPSFPLRVFR